MKKVLLVTFTYPPDNTPAAERMSKFAKYLPEFGWQPVVLAAQPIGASYKQLASNNDPALIIRVPYRPLLPLRAGAVGREVATAPAGASRGCTDSLLALAAERLGLNVMIREPWMWHRPAILEGARLVKSLDVQCMLTSLKPVSTAFVGAGIHKRTRIPWIAEYRDPWSMSPYMHSRRVRPLRILEQTVEKRLIRGSTRIVSVTQYWTQQLSRFHDKPAVCIPHGYDDTNYETTVSPTECFTITYTGAIYPGKRDPTPLFLALAKLRQEGVIHEGRFKVEFYGPKLQTALSEMITSFGLESLVHVHSEVSFEESLRQQQRATVLLLLSWNDPRDAGTLTSKVFAYLGARRPILAMAWEGGELAAMLRESGYDAIANTPSEIEALLRTWIQEYDTQGAISSGFHPSLERIAQYSRKAQAKRLADLLDECSQLPREA
jgi:hypothetical protein